MFPFLYTYSQSLNNKENNSNKEIYNNNVNISHDSLMLNVGISILGLVSTLINYNNFIYAPDYNFSTLLLASLIVFFTAIDTFTSCKKYNINGWKIATIITSIIVMIISLLLLVVSFGIYSEIFTIDVSNNLNIIFNESKQLSFVNNLFTKIGFLKINQYVALYPFAYLIQSLSNLFKFLLRKHKTHKK